MSGSSLSNISYSLLMAAPLLAMLAAAVVTDVRSRRIPNKLTLAIFLTGIARSLCDASPVGFGAAWAGVGVGVAICLGLVLIGALGGGDLKLVAAAGAWVGPVPILAIFALSAVIGLAIVLAHAARHGKLTSLVLNTAIVGNEIVRLRRVEEGQLTAAGQTFHSVDRPLPYAVPMALATMAVLIGCSVVQRGIGL